MIWPYNNYNSQTCDKPLLLKGNVCCNGRHIGTLACSRPFDLHPALTLLDLKLDLRILSSTLDSFGENKSNGEPATKFCYASYETL